jgi:hypothetical protein
MAHFLGDPALEPSLFLINAQVVQIDVPPPRYRQWPNRVDAPKHRGMIRRIVEYVAIVYDRSGSEAIHAP